MSRLVPRQITDKNGVLTTRHVRADSADGTSSETLKAAAPVLAASQREYLYASLCALFDDDNNEIKLDTLSDMELGFLSSLTEHLDKESDKTVVWKLLNPEKTAQRNYISAGDLPDLNTELKALATFHRMDRGHPLNETLCFVRGLWAYDSMHGGCTQEQAQALIDVSHTALLVLSEKPDAFDYPDEDMDGEFRTDMNMFYSFFGGDLEHERDGSMWIRNKKFVDMVLRRPEDAERISEMIKQRQTVVPDIIETLIDSDNHPSLLEGTL